jgi:hypothetical protein
LLFTMSAALLVRRRLATKLNRRLLGMLVVVELLILVNRIGGFVRGDRILTIATTDMLADIAGLALASLFLMGRLAWALVPVVVGVVLVHLLPEEHAVRVLTLATSGMIVVASWAVSGGGARGTARPGD